MSSIFSKVSDAYDNLWKAFIRPPRDLYTSAELGPRSFYIDKARFDRKDFQVQNKRGHSLQCSLYAPSLRLADDDAPCVIYLHGNCSSRVEGLSTLKSLLPLGVLVCTFDFAGAGHSEGEYISLGINEQDDVEAVVQYLRRSEGISAIGLWGRSMGAVTALNYIRRDPSITCLVADSPFTSLKSLAEDLAHTHTKVPRLLIGSALSLLRRSIRKKIGLDVFTNSPVDSVCQSTTPILFVVGLNDTFTPKKHADMLYSRYSGYDKTLHYVEGDHNSRRPDWFKGIAASFFRKRLGVETSVGSFDSGEMNGGDREIFDEMKKLKTEPLRLDPTVSPVKEMTQKETDGSDRIPEVGARRIGNEDLIEQNFKSVLVTGAPHYTVLALSLIHI
eukprot:TRINITY_DN9367_c0_g1_i4.p1 TRINITY_DN9367_c0_g1~~TRINITY_DN9367_c0_g1_i4.p1  ORF type:complete len:388 (-),score=51.76 TRINITY_DN9367_c0_g1_i4:60-1223(-)